MQVISASYGNDSIALIQWAHEVGLSLVGRVVVTYLDTGWAAPTWPARVEAGEDFARRCGFEPLRLQSMGMAELIRSRKGWPGNGQQFCSAHLKGVPFLEWIDETDTERTAVVLIGKRRAESASRANTPEFIDASEYHGGRRLWHPLYLHDDTARNALIERAGFKVLPHRSQECNPCVNANRGDFLRLTPGEIQRVSDLEVEIGKPMFRPKRFHALGIQGVIMWARHGRREVAPEDLTCGAEFGCGL